MAGPSGTVGTGIASQIVLAPEVTYGVAPALTGTPVAIEFKSETLELKKTTVQGQGLHAGGLYDRAGRRIITNYAVAGGITMDLQARRLNLLLKHMLGSVGSTNATLVQNGATGQWKATHVPGPMNGNSLTIQKGVPTVSAVVEPFTYVGCKIMDWTISVKTGAIAELALNLDGRNELASPLVTTPAVPASTVTATNTSVGPVQVVITGGTLTFVTINGVTAGTTAGTYTVPPSGTIAITYSVAPTWVWSPLSFNSDPLNVTVPPLATWTNTSQDVFYFREAKLLTGTPSTASGVTSLTGSTTLANILSASVKHALKLDTSRFFLGSAGFKGEQLENGFRSISGDFEAEWLSTEAMYYSFAADTPLAIQLSFVGFTNIGTSTQPEELDILIPNIKLDGESPKVPGPTVITQKATYTGLDDEINNQIQITYFTSDSAD